MAISEAERTRLRKFIGMLGSAHQGERDNALGFIQRMATEHKLTLTELMAQVGGPAQAQWRPPPPPPPPPDWKSQLERELERQRKWQQEEERRKQQEHRKQQERQRQEEERRRQEAERRKREDQTPPPGTRRHHPARAYDPPDDELLTALSNAVTSGCPRLNKWEREFAADVSKRYQHDGDLSEKQLVVVMRIVEKFRDWDESF